jgi:hypothetical protein
MSEQALIEALDQALALREQGYPLEYCVQQFPQHADCLWPLLQVGDELRCFAQASNALLEVVRVELDWETLLAAIPQDHPDVFTEVSTL